MKTIAHPHRSTSRETGGLATLVALAAMKNTQIPTVTRLKTPTKSSTVE
jgi:hypothetical protein